MNLTSKRWTPCVAVALLLCAATIRAADATDVKMDLLPSGAMKILGQFIPTKLELSAQPPAALKKAPPTTSPLYGAIKFGGTDYLVVLDQPTPDTQVLYLDANANGDLTDDPAITWGKAAQPTNAAPSKRTMFSGDLRLPLAVDGKTQIVTLGAYCFPDPKMPVFCYYADYAYAGEVTLAGAKHKAMLVDMRASGDFTARAGQGGFPAVGLAIDWNNDGKFLFQNELFDVVKPFKITGNTWEVAAFQPDGQFQIVPSTKVAAEPLQETSKVPPPAVKTGDQALPFTALTMDGRTVRFPADYKGKLVLLDFWATWCGPCMREMPTVVQAYNEFHDKGFFILGVSFDREDSVNRITSTMTSQGMAWPQIYEGKYWDTVIGRAYHIFSIPSAFLVDGDTGKILASGNEIYGERLQRVLKAEFQKKSAAAP